MRRALAVGVVLGSLVGCLEPHYEVCGTLICPESSVCLPDGTCASAESVAACDGIADGAACTTALFTGSCVGTVCVAPRCGDNVVAGSEQCDGSVGGVDCVDYGYDLGIPTCSDRCALDVTDSCTRFGWRRLIQTAADDGWTDGTTIAVIRRDRYVVDAYMGGATVASPELDTSVFLGVTGSAAGVVAWTSEGAVLQLTGTTWTELDLAPIDNQVEEAQLAPDGTLYVMASGAGCEVWSKPPAGTWTMLYANAVASCDVLRLGGSRLLLAITVGSISSVLERTGAAWPQVFSPPSYARDLAIDGAAIYAITSQDGIVRYSGGQVTSFDFGFADQVIATDQGVFAGGGGDADIIRIVGDHVEAFAAPVGGALMGDGHTLYMAGNGVYEYAGAQYAWRDGLAGATQSVAVMSDGFMAFAVDNVLAVEDPTDLFNLPTVLSNEQITSLTGRSLDEMYVTSGMTVERCDGASYVDITPPGLTSTIRDLWSPASGSTRLYAVGEARLGLALSGTSTWTPLTPPVGSAGCDLHAITGSASQILAAGTCASQGVVWSLAGTTWTELHRGSLPLEDIALDAAGNVYAVGEAGGVRRIAGVWSEDLQARGRSVGATGPDDVWVAGTPSDVIHWDGVTWSRLGLTGAVDPRIAVTPRTVYFVGTSQAALLR